MANKYITPEQYEKLTESAFEDYRYVPEYTKYEVKKVRDYDECDCCGNRRFVGWVEHKTPVGSPYRYRRIKKDVMDHLADYYSSRFLEMTQTNTIINNQVI